MNRYIIKRNSCLLNRQGEMESELLFGPGRKDPKIYKTRKAAERKAAQLRGLVLAIDERGLIL